MTDKSARREKYRRDQCSADDWLAAHPELSQRIPPGSHAHPALRFSAAIGLLLEDFKKGSDDALLTLVSWICRDERAPFGMILKIKAFRVMIQNSARISPRVWAMLAELQDKVDEREYRPREYLYLDKLLAKRGA